MVSLCAGVPAHCGRSRGVDGEGDADPGATSTALIVPPLLIFFFAQRTFIQGITLTGMKG